MNEKIATNKVDIQIYHSTLEYLESIRETGEDLEDLILRLAIKEKFGDYDAKN